MQSEVPPSPRIERITLQDIGPFDGASFEPLPPTGPGELVLFEGPNGSGKTTILEAIAALICAPEWSNTLSAPAAPVPSLQRRIRGGAPRLALDLTGGCSVSTGVTTGKMEWSGDPGLILRIRGLEIAAESNAPTDWAAFAFRGAQPTASLATEGPKRIDRPALRGALSFAEVSPASAELGQILVNIYFDHLQAWRAAEQAKGTPAEPALRHQADALQASLDRFAHALTEVLERKVTIDFVPGQRPPVIRLDGEIIPLDLLGEGFRRTLAWLSDLVARLELTPWKDPSRSPFDQDFWLLLDEIDQSLHPTLQRHILPTLRRLFPNARIYATTHSPFVVASAPDGCVFPIRPDPRTHRVSGAVAPIKLGPGHSLSWAVEEVFDVPSSFVDEETITRLATHKRWTDRLRRGETEGFDWAAFAALRAPLVASEGEGRAIVQLREAPVRSLIDGALRDLARAAHEGL
jgi:hypothetical protein